LFRLVLSIAFVLYGCLSSVSQLKIVFVSIIFVLIVLVKDIINNWLSQIYFNLFLINRYYNVLDKAVLLINIVFLFLYVSI